MTIEARRIANYTGKERCPHCANSAMVCASKRQQFKSTPDMVEEMAPCPKCEKGARLEFGLYRDKEGNEQQHEKGGAWGKEGFWKGKMHTFWAEIPRGDEDGAREPIPEWVKIWRWCRDLGDDRILPQEDRLIAPRDSLVMSDEEYAATREAWRRAGAPVNGDPLHLGGEVLSSL